MTTLKEVFAITMAIIDELDESGSADANSNEDYAQRTLGIITAALGELYPYSDTYTTTSGRRAVCPTVSSFDEALPIDDFLCRTVLPCVLAARLLLDENPAVAAYYERRYLELLARYGNMHAAVSEPIADVYGGLGTWR